MTVSLFTVGHGAVPAAELLERLECGQIDQVVDVRRFPGSRKHPQYSSEALADALGKIGVGYRWEERLGGRRRPPTDSLDMALRHPSFRGYAAWMREPDFIEALDELLAGAGSARTAVLCSETVWWRCHRRMISDAAQLLWDMDVRHLMPAGRLTPHAPTSGVRRLGSELFYDVVDGS